MTPPIHHFGTDAHAANLSAATIANPRVTLAGVSPGAFYSQIAGNGDARGRAFPGPTTFRAQHIPFDESRNGILQSLAKPSHDTLSDQSEGFSSHPGSTGGTSGGSKAAGASFHGEMK